MKRLLAFLIILSSFAHAYSTNITGTWHGELNLGSIKLNLVFHFTETTCTLDSPDQGAKGIAGVVNVNSNDSISVSFPNLAAIYNGHVAGERIEGTFTQNGYNLRLTLERGELVRTRLQTPHAPFPYKTEEVVFSNPKDSTILAGTLAYPNLHPALTGGVKQYPVVLFVTGSGLQDRDETLFDHKPFAVIADYLARNGIASLRFDDRSAGKSTGDAASATTQTFMEDALAGIAYLRGRSEFSHVGVLGHSEGGTIAFMLGAQNKADFLVTLAAPGLRGDTVLVEQTNALLQHQGKKERWDVRGMHIMMATQEQTPWYQFFMAYEPKDDIAATKCPVFALNGEKDMQVMASSNHTTLMSLLPENPLTEGKTYPELNHLFQHCTTGMPDEYGQIEETISPEVLNDIASWISSTCQKLPTSLSPQPQQTIWGDEVYATKDLKIVSFNRNDKAAKRFRKLIPNHKEGYYLKVSKDGIVVAGNDEAGTFYGMQTLAQLMKGDSLRQVEITDWPTMPERGVIEGYYGNPYSHQDRLRLFRFMGENKMNVFVYGPKDDPYHRSQWRDDYPADEQQRMKELIEKAHESHVKFVWAIHPGGDIRWELSDSLAIVRKCESMYNLGVRSFCVFFDDIGGEGARAEKQAALLNYMTDKFVRRHKDVEPLMMCPTQYNKGWSGGDYLNILGTQMYPEVRIMWTGNTVIDMIDREDMEWINKQISRKAYIWLNYPVTDYCIDHLLMGKTYGNGLDIGDLVSGFCSNPMEYCEASKLSLFSIADYAWNPALYDDERSWQMAIESLTPEHKEAFRLFCENNVDLGVTGHGLRRIGESPRFLAAFDQDPTITNTRLEKVFADMGAAAQELLADKSQPELSAEIRPWVESMAFTSHRGESVLKMYNCLMQGDSVNFVDNYQQYAKLTNEQLALRSRNFKGSIKIATPVVATNYVEPWLRKEAQALTEAYRSHYGYRHDVFPKEALTTGTYFIKINGHYLTDPDYKLPNAQATFVAERDTINPQSQEWTITFDANTGRYKIENNQARRYLNEIGRFGTNPYNATWNPYEITERNGKYVIRNAENAGTAYWTLTPDSLHIGYSGSEPTPFEIIPVE